MAPSTSNKSKSRREASNGTRSPFFAPTTPKVTASTPGGTQITRKAAVNEHKSTVIGASANLMNAIVGAGIVSIPYALKESGIITGVLLVALCAALTFKSLRLLVETAKHTNVPSYETLAEACFGNVGFLFILLNMFVMSFGAMISYLMITRDTLPVVMGVSPTDVQLKNAILFVLSLLIMVPLSCQRDMADLAKTSRISVTFDFIMVGIVFIISPWQINIAERGLVEILETSIFRPETVFVGLGVLSFAFVCQHSAFIIAGSLENPTKVRWGKSVLIASVACGLLATVCGTTGYLGYLETTQGNILNNLGDSKLANLARSLLGVCMIFVYPLESFVARHVCVVILFRGRRAHEGEDAAILNRRDRRITLTVTLYVLALVPAIVFQDLGTVLAATGAVGGSCLSYIGPGATYLGAHGAEFLASARRFYGSSWWATNDIDMDEVDATDQVPDAWYTIVGKTLLWYGTFMPLWCSIATLGSNNLRIHQEEMALKSPHPSRIGKVQQRQILQMAAKRLEEGDAKRVEQEPLIRSGSLHMLGERTVLPPEASYQKPITPIDIPEPKLQPQASVLSEQAPPEEDPQADPATLYDFLVAIFYMIFGVVALAAGIVSIANSA
jgi:sodium-coupled neutral amino acid transporter 11